MLSTIRVPTGTSSWTLQSSEPSSEPWLWLRVAANDYLQHGAHTPPPKPGGIYRGSAQLFPSRPRWTLHESSSEFIGADQTGREKWRDKILSELGSRGTEEPHQPLKPKSEFS